MKEQAWTKKSGKKKSGGLNEKGRKSYERENPGSDLKAPSKKVGNPRRASFCARMKGMKKKLTSKKTARDLTRVLINLSGHGIAKCAFRNLT